ncbi:MAG: MerR family transcriptional regulator [Anaerolineae bacterium]|nr:MerR family transcriptional regulator [Anaerolineae bacterium]
MKDTTPSYNLKVIVRETGIKPDTLRAWERRYNLPVPDRTPGGHRLYSPRDLEIVKWLMAREQEGMRISQAVQLFRDLVESGDEPLQEMVAPPPGTSFVPDTAVGDLAALRDAWVQASLRFDEDAAEQQVVHALARHAPELVSLELLQKGVSEMGQLWYEGKATVQQEHFASAMALRRVNALLAAAPPPIRSQLVYLACPPGEEHAFPLLLLALLLRYRGWHATYLGANVPLEQLESALQAARPALFVMAAQTLPAAATTLEMARFLQEREVPLAYGGFIYSRLPQLQERMPGFFLGDGLPEAAARIAEILMSEPEMPAGTPLADPYRATLACFERDHRLLAGRVWQIMRSQDMPERHLRMANEHLGRGIRAALAFGDINLVDHEIGWVRQLLDNHEIPAEALGGYLQVYHQVAQDLLGDDCRPILDWLAAKTT